MPIDFHQLPHKDIQTLTPYQPGKSIEELQREKGISNIIKMASNENPLGCSPLALDALYSMSPSLVATYPSPANHHLMPKLANKLQIPVEKLFLSNGSDHIFSMLLYCFALHTNKHMLTHEYAFSTYAIQAKTLHIPVRIASISPNWLVNIEHLIQTTDSDTGIIFVANPNNPTGVLISPAEVKSLLEHIPQSTILVLDEAYHEFAASQFNYNSLEWIEEHPNLVVTRTFSKIYGMAGLRLGYAIAHPSIIELLYKVQLPFTVNQTALTAAFAALDDEDFIQLSLQTNKEGMHQMRQGFKQLNINYLPSSCNFLTFDCQEDGLALYNYLLNQGIIVRPLHAYKMNQYIRVTIGTQEQNSCFLNALRNYLHQ